MKTTIVEGKTCSQSCTGCYAWQQHGIGGSNTALANDAGIVQKAKWIGQRLFELIYFLLIP